MINAPAENIEYVIVVRIYHGYIRMPWKNKLRPGSGDAMPLFGHVALQVEDRVYGFFYARKRNIHIVPRPHNKNCEFQNQSISEWELIVKEKRETCVHIPVSAEEIQFLKAYYERNCREPEVDYSFIGERCASNTFHLLQRLGKIGKGHYILNAFWPEAFRKRLIKESAKRGYKITVKDGDVNNTWIGDIKSFPPHQSGH